VVFTDTGRRIIYANPALRVSHGYAPEEVIGFSSTDLFGDIPGNPDDLGPKIAEEAVGGVWRGEVYNRRKDGSVFPVRLTVSTVYDADLDILGYIGISTDITEEKRREAELNLTLKQLRKASDFKGEFISTLSHEIRTPLTSIRAFSNILLTMGDRADEATRREFIGQIHAASERLNGMLNRMLELAKIESGEMSFNDEVVNLTGAALEAVADMQGLALEKNVAIDLCNPPLEVRVVADRDRIREVFLNLLSNAIKYSPPGSTVSIELGWKEKGKGAAEVRIRDQGPGIPDGMEETIFERFQQGDRSGENGHGVGLGLAICREILRHYGGGIRAGNGPEGAVFTFTLPSLT